MTSPLWRYLLIWMWASTLASLTGGVVAIRHYLHSQPESRTVLLLPLNRMDPDRRAQEVELIEKYPEFASAKWLSPSDLAQQTAEQLPRDQWPELFSTEEAWLPWLLEAELANPVGDTDAARSRIAYLQQQSTWRLVTWDEASAVGGRDRLGRVSLFVAVCAVVVFFLGIGALRVGPAVSVSGVQQVIVGTIGCLGVLAPVAFALHTFFGAQPEEVWGAMGVAGFLLAGVIGPMIKGRSAAEPVAEMLPDPSAESQLSSGPPPHPPESPEAEEKHAE